MSRSKASHGARSVPHKGPYVASMAFAFLHYLSIVAGATLGYILIRTGEPDVANWLILSMCAIALTWLLNYASRRTARCPLCTGTPLLDNRAAKHRKAVRLKPLNYGVTAQLSLLIIQRFRCMYCGTPFDLHREPNRMNGEQDGEF
ncbi:hypothetical protein HAHE_11770 [Haloferula helveola]|uniref:Transposase n=1 Tax=Haloferula helveola TaxID=490095 RepID=A0ABM7REC3_9BACT|nr:hypothetical protein HAHE_11770 [Haloferula helveola]